MSISPPASFEAMIRAIVVDVVRAEIAALRTTDEYLSTRAAASLAKVTDETIRRWVAAGRLKPRRAGRHIRIRRAELEALLDKPTPRAASISPEALARRTFR